MSVHLLHTFTVHCDSCDEVYADVVQVDGDTIERFAVRDGWRIVSLDCHRCPKCVASSSTPEMLSLEMSSPSRESVISSPFAR